MTPSNKNNSSFFFLERKYTKLVGIPGDSIYYLTLRMCARMSYALDLRKVGEKLCVLQTNSFSESLKTFLGNACPYVVYDILVS